MPTNYFSRVKPVSIFRALVTCWTRLARVLADAVLVVVIATCLRVAASAFIACWAELTRWPRHHCSDSTAYFTLVAIVAVKYSHTHWVGQLFVESVLVVRVAGRIGLAVFASRTRQAVSKKLCTRACAISAGNASGWEYYRSCILDAPEPCWTDLSALRGEVNWSGNVCSLVADVACLALIGYSHLIVARACTVIAILARNLPHRARWTIVSIRAHAALRRNSRGCTRAGCKTEESLLALARWGA